MNFLILSLALTCGDADAFGAKPGYWQDAFGAKVVRWEIVSEGDPYTVAYADAVTRQLPLVVGVGCPVPPGVWVPCQVDYPWHGYKKSIIVSVPQGRTMMYKATLPIGASATQIRNAAVGEVMAVPVPFFERR